MKALSLVSLSFCMCPCHCWCGCGVWRSHEEMDMVVEGHQPSSICSCVRRNGRTASPTKWPPVGCLCTRVCLITVSESDFMRCPLAGTCDYTPVPMKHDWRLPEDTKTIKSIIYTPFALQQLIAQRCAELSWEFHQFAIRTARYYHNYQAGEAVLTSKWSSHTVGLGIYLFLARSLMKAFRDSGANVMLPATSSSTISLEMGQWGKVERHILGGWRRCQPSVLEWKPQNQGALGSFHCGQCVGTSWMMKALMLLTDSHNPQTGI